MSRMRANAGMYRIVRACGDGSGRIAIQAEGLKVGAGVKGGADESAEVNGEGQRQCEHVRQVLVKGGCRHRQRNKRLRQRVRGAGTKIQSEQRVGQAVSLFKAAGYEDQAQRVRNIGSRKSRADDASSSGQNGREAILGD